MAGIELEDGNRREFDHVISTMPVTRLVGTLGDIPAAVEAAAGALRFRHTVFAYLHLRGEHLFPDQWVYVHSPELRTGRVTNFANWVPEIRGSETSTVLALEYWCNTGDALWQESDEAVAARAEGEIRSMGLVADAAITDRAVIKAPQVYPVYARGFRAHLDTVVAYLATFSGLTAIGRGGAFKYNNQDHSILMGILVVENLLEGRQHDLWAVNTGDDYHESAVITQGGLVPAP